MPTTVQTLVTKTADYVTSTEFNPATLRARSLVVAASKLKPNTSMYTYMSGLSMDQNYIPCTVIKISGVTGTFKGYKNQQQIDNIVSRTTPINTYDTILCGEVITCTAGSAVVIADETIFDYGTLTNTRVLYVTNIKPNLFYTFSWSSFWGGAHAYTVGGGISGTIKGLTSLATATVVSSTAGVRQTNSLGNMYGLIAIPALTLPSGDNIITISDIPNNSDVNAASTEAQAGYTSSGDVHSFTTHINYQSQQITTVTPANSGGGSQFSGNAISDINHSTYLCTLMKDLGVMDKKLWLADLKYGKMIKDIAPNTFIGYELWAQPLAIYIKANINNWKGKILFHLVKPFVMAWAKQISGRRDNFLGALIVAFGEPFCAILGTIKQELNRTPVKA